MQNQAIKRQNLSNIHNRPTPLGSRHSPPDAAAAGSPTRTVPAVPSAMMSRPSDHASPRANPLTHEQDSPRRSAPCTCPIHQPSRHSAVRSAVLGCSADATALGHGHYHRHADCCWCYRRVTPSRLLRCGFSFYRRGTAMSVPRHSDCTKPLTRPLPPR
ncbi:hypothetical protein PLESTM_001874700 [Pleodorina starrii]|nr:hypothetical protein PLESTM_001874700 [Pleodorina starrii]